MGGKKGRSGVGKKSPETIEKMKIEAKKRWENQDYRNNHIQLMQKRYQYMRDRPPEAHPRFNQPVKGETIQKRLNTIKERNIIFVPWNKGLTKETSLKLKEMIEKMSKSLKEGYASGRIKPNYGAFKPGEKHLFFNNWSSLLPYDQNFNREFKLSILQRDNHRCIVCGNSEKSLNIHHVDYNKQNTCEENCITLCDSCHARTNIASERYSWFVYLTELMNDLYDYDILHDDHAMLNLIERGSYV